MLHCYHFNLLWGATKIEYPAIFMKCSYWSISIVINMLMLLNHMQSAIFYSLERLLNFPVIDFSKFHTFVVHLKRGEFIKNPKLSVLYYTTCVFAEIKSYLSW